jgi:hypothetical protein
VKHIEQQAQAQVQVQAQVLQPPLPSFTKTFGEAGVTAMYRMVVLYGS